MHGHTTGRVILRSFGRLFDFTGTHNYELWSERCETPAFIRDCDAFEQDKEAIAGDINKAFTRVKLAYAKEQPAQE